MMKRELFTPDRLFCPGPTPVPKVVLDAGEATSVYHRSDEFYKVFRGAAELLKPLFGTQELPVILTASGTGAMEAAITTLTAPGDQVVVVNAGKFGERWQKLASAYQCQVQVVDVPWGQAPTAAQIRQAIAAQTETKAVFLQANETSTGAYFPVEQLARELRQTFRGLIVVDAISSLGAHPMRMDDWQIDCVVAGSQKGFGLPPGLSFCALSSKAWASISTRPRFYFDLVKERQGQSEGRSAYTPAASLVFMLKAALDQMHAHGVEQIFAHHAAMAKAARAAAAALDLTLFPASAPSNALTVFTVPAGIDGQRLVKRLRERFGMYFAGGQDQLKGKIVRFAHLGFVSRFDVLDGLAALEFALSEEGLTIDLGAGVKAAMQAFAEA